MNSHCVYRTEYHIVLTPRYRRRIFVKWVDEYLKQVLMNVEGLDEDIEVAKVNVQSDHVHLMTRIPSRLSVASVVQFMKSQSEKKLRDRFDFIRKATERGEMWSRGYCASTIGLNEAAILRCVEHQEKDDKNQLTSDF